MIPWKIYYSDGTTYTGVPENAPAFGVQVIVHQDKEHGKYLVHNYDYYWYLNNRWEGGDIVGLIDYLAFHRPSIVCFGRIISNEEFQEIYSTALMDKDFKPKTAYSFREKKP
jgi:hypothetical protein